MAAQASDIVDLPRLRTELRIGAGVTAHDTMIQSQAKEAIAFVSEIIGRPLLDATKTVYPRWPGKERPLCLEADWIKSVDEVKYWSTTGALRSDPDGTVADGDLGRKTLENPRSWVWPPEAGWADILSGSTFQVTVTRGYDLDGSSEGIRAAIILATRQLYRGFPEIRPTNAFYRFLEPWDPYGV